MNGVSLEFQLILLNLGSIISFSFGIVYKTIRVNKPDKNNTLDEIAKDVEWIKDIHDQRDSNGMPLWYVPRELKQLCNQTASAMILMNHNLSDIKDILSHNTTIMEELLHQR